MPQNHNISNRMLLINPAVIDALSRVSLSDNGHPREGITVPISQAEEVSDTTLFEEPTNAASKYFLPCYRVATERTTAGREQYRIVLEERAPGWFLRLHLVKYPAKEIELAVREAKELPHQVTVILRYFLAGSGGVQKELVFGEITSEDGGLQVAVQLKSRPECDELYVAMTEPESNAVLIVRRTIRVAITIPPSRDEDPVKPIDVVRPIPVRPINVAQPLPVRPIEVARPFTVRIDGPVRSVTNMTSVRLDAVNRFPVLVDLVVPQPRFREVDRILDNEIQFIFKADLHGYIYGAIASAGARPGLIPYQVRWGNKFQSYYQETSRPYLFYYLPDAFKLARRPESPHLPFMSVGFTSADGSLEALRVTLAYVAVPFVDHDRLDAAAQVLKSQVSWPLPDGVDGPVFQPLLADTKRLAFRLALPGTADLFQPREGAMVNLKLGIVDSLRLSLSEFQAVFDALMGSGNAAVLMIGEVEVSLDDQDIQIAEKVPFTARMADLAGEIFEYHYSPDPESGGVQVKLRNTIESPVRIDHLGAELRHDGNEVADEIRGLTLPVERLAPGGELSFTVVPAAPLTSVGPVEAIFDLDGVTVLPDREAIWNAIQESFTAQYQQVITVKTLPAIFNLPQGRPEEERLSEIVVELKRGDDLSVSVVLKPETPEVQVSLPFPIRDVILRSENSGEYRYRVMAIRLSGETQKDWKTKTGDRLYLLQEDVM